MNKMLAMVFVSFSLISTVAFSDTASSTGSPSTATLPNSRVIVNSSDSDKGVPNHGPGSDNPHQAPIGGLPFATPNIPPSLPSSVNSVASSGADSKRTKF